jgi:hypothetical protein
MNMIIFGWGKATNLQYGPTLGVTCPNCNNETWYHLLRRRLWFTLFFIPVIPYSSEYLLLCQVCSQGIKLTGDKIEKAKRLNELTQKLLNKEMSASEYQFETKNIKLLE